jgi:hypothetical protein
MIKIVAPRESVSARAAGPGTFVRRVIDDIIFCRECYTKHLTLFRTNFNSHPKISRILTTARLPATRHFPAVRFPTFAGLGLAHDADYRWDHREHLTAIDKEPIQKFDGKAQRHGIK